MDDVAAPTAAAGTSAIAGPPPPPYHNSSWSLISQGAEARLWKVPNYYSISTPTHTATPSSPPGSTTTTTTTAVAACKERFPKSYRHPQLDASLTKSRTRGEARCLVRCRRGGVPCPAVLGVDHANAKAAGSNRDKSDQSAGDKSTGGTADEDGGSAGKPPQPSPPPSSSCLFLEWIDGCTVREYLATRAHYPEDEADFAMERDSDDERVEIEGSVATSSSPANGGREPAKKRAKVNEDSYPKVKMTRVDDEAKSVARAIGILVADMHNVNIVHGDLTTSNVMMRNPPPSPPPTAAADDTTNDKDQGGQNKWKPSLVLIDFGLSSTAGSKGVSHEEKAVDLYVLERAFEATHPGSKALVAELHRTYKGRCKTSDSVLQRLGQVRLRGRKRECFG